MLSIKKTIKHLVYRLGYETRRPQAGIRHKKAPPTVEPMIIEFIGSPGVGKTTIYEKLISLSKSWPQKTLLIPVAPKIDNYFTEVYNDLLKLKLNNISSQNVFIRSKYWKLKYFYSMMQTDVLIVNLQNNGYHVLADEGLFHNFSEEIINLYNEHPSKFHALAKNRAFIYCYCDPTTIGSRAYSRRKTTAGHYRLSERQIVDYSKKTISVKKELAKIINAHKYNCIKIDTSDRVADNADTINDFIKTIEKRPKLSLPDH